MLAFDRFDSRTPSTTAPKIDARATRNAGVDDTTHLLTHTGPHA